MRNVAFGQTEVTPKVNTEVLRKHVTQYVGLDVSGRDNSQLLPKLSLTQWVQNSMS